MNSLITTMMNAKVQKQEEDITSQIPSAFRVKVVWDAPRKEVIPKVIKFNEDVVEELKKEVKEYIGYGFDFKEAFDELVVKHLEATTDWLVKDWKMI